MKSSIRLARALRSLPKKRNPSRVLSAAKVILSPDACRRLGVIESPTLEIRLSRGRNIVFAETATGLEYIGGFTTVYSRRYIPASKATINAANDAHRACVGYGFL